MGSLNDKDYDKEAHDISVSIRLNSSTHYFQELMQSLL